MKPKFLVSFSALSSPDRVTRVELTYDSDSPFTWLDPEVYERLDLPAYQESRIVLPGRGDPLHVQTAIVRVGCQSFHGVEEVVLAPTPGLARLGWRTLLAIHAQIDERELPPDSGAGPNRTFNLVRRQTLEPYNELCKRASSLGVPAGEFDVTLQRGSLPRAAVAVRYFVYRLARHAVVSTEILAEELFLLLTRLLQFRRVAVMVVPAADVTPATAGGPRWVVVRRSKDFRATDWPKVEFGDGPEVDSGGARLQWDFPSNPAEVGSEDRLRCRVEADGLGDRFFLKKLFSVLGSAVDLALWFAAESAALHGSRDDAKLVLTFPRSKVDTVSYGLLKHAKRVIPGWTHASFWRTSRTSRRLEKTAEFNIPERDIQKNTVGDWAPVPPAPAPHELLDFPAGQTLTVVAVPARDGSRNEDYGILHHLFDVRDPLWGGRADVRGVGFDLHLSRDGSAARAGDRPWVEVVRANVERLLGTLPLTGSELVLVEWSYLRGFQPHPKTDDFGKTPDDFHFVVVIVADHGGLAAACATHATHPAVSRPALKTLGRAMALRLQQYNVLSWNRYQLRQVGDFLNAIYTAESLDDLRTIIRKCLRSLLHTGFFLVLDRRTNRVVLAPERLAGWLDRPVRLPELGPGAVKPYRDVAGQLGGEYRELAAAVLDAIPPEKSRPNKRKAKDSVEDTGGWGVGGIFATVSNTHALLVLHYGWTNWKISSTEYSSVRVISAALQHAAPLAARPADPPPRPQDWSAQLPDSLVSKVPDVRGRLQGFLKALTDDLATGLAAGEAASASLFAVDGDEMFVHVIAGPKQGMVQRNSPSMVTAALHRRGPLEAHFVPLLGVVTDAGTVIQLVDQQLVPLPGRKADTTVPFLGMVPGVPGDVMVVQGFTRVNRLALGFLVVRLGPVDFLCQTDRLARAVDRVAVRACEAALFLQRQIELRAAEVRLACEAPLRQLKSPTRPLITRLSDLVHESQQSTGHLPWALRRLFTAEYCESVQVILRQVLQSTGVLNLSCRIRYPGADGRDRLWRIASTGDPTFDTDYDYDPKANIHSYVCDQPDDPGGDVPCKRAFIPDVTNAKFTGELYSGVRYQGGHPDTVAELCYGFRIPGKEVYCVSFDTESGSFHDLWMLEDFFRQMAAQIAAEIVLHYRRAEATDRAGAAVGSMFVQSLEHTIRRPLRGETELPVFGDATQTERVLLEIDIGQNLSEAARRVPVDNLLRHAVARFLMRVRPTGLINKSGTPLAVPDVQMAPVFGDILAKLLLEQADTLCRMTGGVEQQFLLARRPTHDGRHVVVDLLSTGPRCRPDQVKIACGLFWYEIDLRDRPAAGRYGRGMYLIGHMLRLVGCRPRVHPQPLGTVLRAYPPPLANLIRDKMTGMAIELYLPAESGGGAGASDGSG